MIEKIVQMVSRKLRIVGSNRVNSQSSHTSANNYKLQVSVILFDISPKLRVHELLFLQGGVKKIEKFGSKEEKLCPEALNGLRSSFDQILFFLVFLPNRCRPTFDLLFQYIHILSKICKHFFTSARKEELYFLVIGRIQLALGP
jgi:hypothetical protein